MAKLDLPHPLAELLDDPIVTMVMKSDGVDRRSLTRLFMKIGHTRGALRTVTQVQTGTPTRLVSE